MRPFGVPPSSGSASINPTPADLPTHDRLKPGLRASLRPSLLGICLAAALALLAHPRQAAEQVSASSARYTVSHRTLDLGGGRTRLATLDFDTALGGFGGTAKTADGRITFELGRIGFLMADDPLNLAPTISPVANQNGDGGSTPRVTFTVTDSETSAGDLRVSATSSNSILVPSGSIGLGGSGSNRNVQVLSAPGKTGTAVITLSVTDAKEASATTQFTVTVNVPAPKLTPEVTWPTPASITFGAALGSSQLNATAAVPGAFAYTPAAGTKPDAGTVVLSVTFTPTDAETYQAATKTVSLTVAKAPLTIRAEDKSKVYGAALPALTVTYSGFVNGDTFASLDTPASLSTTATAASDAGTYPITVSSAADANYSMTFVPGALTVTPVTLLISAENKSKVYGAALPVLTAAYSGFVIGDTAANLDTPVQLTTTAALSSNVGTYPITASAAADANYTIRFVAGTLTVNQAPLSATADNASRAYGSANPAFSGVIVGIQNNDKITATYSTTATTTSPVGTYPIVPSLFDLESKLGNYTVAKVNGTLTVKNVPPVVNAGPDQEKVALDEVTFAGSFTDPSSPSHVVGWDFGDGSPAVIGTLAPTHIYAHHGVYTVRLTVTDSHLASASDTLTVTVISALGCATEARDELTPFVKESQRLEKVVKDLTASLEPKLWVDEVHLNPKGGREAFVYWRQATDMMEQMLKPSQKRDNDARDADDGEDDDEFKKLFNDSKKDTLSAAAITAIQQALADVICASQLISETLYLENENLVALDPRRQKRVDAALTRAKEYLDEAKALVEKGDFGKVVRFYIRSWNNTQEAIEIAGRSQPAKELTKALELIEESLDPKYWADEPLFAHLDQKTGQKAFNLMQSAARELANVVQDAAKGRVIPAVGQQAADELSDLVEKARLLSRTLYAENEHLVAVNPKNQKGVDAELKRAKEDLDKGVAAEAENDFDKALTSYANAWDDTVRAIEEAAKAR